MSKLALALAALAMTMGEAGAGEVRGVVRLAGAAPTAVTLAVTKDNAACGQAVADESLVAAGGNLANVVVTIRGAPPPGPVHGTLDQQGCRFVPHVQVVPVGSTLEFLNADPVLHTAHGWVARRERFDVPTPMRGTRASTKLDRAETISVRCDVHGWMSAYVVVTDAPAALTGGDGAFSIRGVPPGSYTVRAWHERLGERTTQVTVPAQGEARIEFTFGR
jgi:plastocyanin